MSFLIKFILGKFSGPLLVYVVLGLVAANAMTGYLLKRAYDANVRAALECENAALRDANTAKEAVTAELMRIQAQLADERERAQAAAANADKIIAGVVAANDARDLEQTTDLEVAVNEITDTDFWCGSETVPFGVLVGLRLAATAYNQARNSEGSGISPDPD